MLRQEKTYICWAETRNVILEVLKYLELSVYGKNWRLFVKNAFKQGK